MPRTLGQIGCRPAKKSKQVQCLQLSKIVASEYSKDINLAFNQDFLPIP